MKDLTLRLLLLILMIMPASALPAAVQEYAVADVPNVQLADRNRFVSDPTGVLSPATVAAVDAALADLRARTTAEMVVVVVPSTGDVEPAQFAHQLLNEWGVGQKDRDNGAVLLIATQQKKAFFATGYGLEGPLPDITTQKILQQTVVPAMKENNPDKAVADAVGLTATVPVAYTQLTQPTNKEV